MVKKVFLSMIVLSLVAISANAVNVINNGSFELPDVDPGVYATYGSTESGWTPDGWPLPAEMIVAHPDFGDPGNPVPDGEQCGGLNVNKGMWSDTFTLTVGDALSLTYSNFGTGSPLPGNTEINCWNTFAIKSVDNDAYILDGGSGVTAGAWVDRSFDMTVPSVDFNSNALPTTGTYKIRFWHAKRDGGQPDASAYLIDNVVMTPEPCTLILLGLGGIAAIRRRR